MNITNSIIICTGCGCCAEICPQKTISMKLDESGFPRPIIVDSSLCVDCGLCVGFCPQLNFKDNAESDFKRIDYYGWSLNEKNHYSGTSGGIFPEIAHQHVNAEGVVFGAIWSDDFRDVIIEPSSVGDVEKIFKSKYVFSDATNSYKQVASYLLDGRKVLYCGAPCQIGALLNVLDKEKISLEKLITCDFICGGFPSKKFWYEHLESLTKKYGEISSIDFRSKRRGWKHAYLEIKFQNGKRIIKRSFTDSYYNCFSDMHISVQQACNTCNYRSKHRADITLADFWEYKKAGVQLNNKGLSLVIINTEKGKNFLKDIVDLKLNLIDEKAVQYVFKGVESPEKRYEKQKAFFEKAKSVGFEKAANEIAITTWSGRIMIHLKKRFKKFLK